MRESDQAFQAGSPAGQKLAVPNRVLEAAVTAVLVASLIVTGSPAAAQEAADADAAATREYNATAALQNGGLYPRAAEKWAAFIAKYPKDERLDRAHYYLGICQLHQKKFPEAATSFRAVLAKFPQFKMLDGAQYNLAMALYQQAAAAKDANQLKAAATEFATLVQKYAQSPHAAKGLYFRSEALYQAGDKPGAVASYQQLLAQYATSPLVPDSLYALGTVQQELEQFEDAAKTYGTFLGNAAFAKHDLAAEIRLRLGLCQFQLKQFAEGEKTFAEAAAIPEFPHADFALLRLAQCRLEQNKSAEALAALGELTTKFPQSAYRNAGQTARGKAHFLAGQFDQAAAPLDEVWKANAAESAEAAYWLGRTLLAQTQPDAALAMLEAAVAKYPQGEFAPHLQLTRIDALADLPARRKEAAAAYENFAKQFPEHPLAPQSLYMAGATALSESDYATARRLADAFLANPMFAENPLTAGALYVAAESHLLALGGEDAAASADTARQRYEQLVAKFPEHPRTPVARVRIGWCMFQSKQYDPAVQSLTAALNSIAAPELKAEAQFLIGRSHSAAGREPQATAAYDAALAAKPDWERGDEVLLAAAASRRIQTQLDPARQSLEKLLASFPQSKLRPQAIYELGELAQQTDKADEAIARFNDVVTNHADTPVAPAAAYSLAAIRFARKEFPAAIQTLDLLLTKYPQSSIAPAGTLLRGLAHQQEKQFDPAVKDLQQYLATKPTGDDALNAQYAMAVCQIGLKQHAPAIAALQQLVAQQPEYVNADKVFYELGHALLETDKPADAVAAFRSLVTKKPDSPLAAESWFQIGRSHDEAAAALTEQAAKDANVATMRTAELTKAAEAFDAGLKLAATDDLKEKLQYKLADMFFRQEKLAEAAAQLAMQMQMHPSGELFGPAAFLAAECHFRLGQFDKALPLYQTVAERKVEAYHAQSLYRAGAAAAALKNWPASQTFYTQLLQAFPKFEQADEANYGMGWALQNQNKKAEAAAVYKPLTELDTEAGAKARFMLGELAFEEKKYEDAVEQFLFVAVGYPYAEWQALARFEAARCFVELGAKDKAIEQLAALVERHADHPKAKDAMTLLAELKK